jgi:ERCC4-related helicase
MSIELMSGTSVNHARFGRGIVEVCKGTTTLVRFQAGYQECLTGELVALSSAVADYESGRSSDPVKVIVRLLAETIRSINDAWGVFTPARIDLLPHQLWVCRKATETWPVRWVIADDVGLGKTIEAGLILWRLRRLDLVKRLLILCPASLVIQWQTRLFNMFDIRTALYDSRQDTKVVDFWKLNPSAVASFHTLREDKDGRHDRMLDTDPWDLIIVDEAHHLNVDEHKGMTNAHALIRKLQDEEKLQSLLLFTGTPHRGKHFGFFALMSLVRPDLFDPRGEHENQFASLRNALIRNNKYSVTNLRGERLFKRPEVHAVNYSYSPAEANFYDMMTSFVASGNAYSTKLDGTQGRAVMLVLIALQKLASSSIAALRSALQKRLVKMREIGKQLAQKSAQSKLVSGASDLAEDFDLQSAFEEDSAPTVALDLMENECARLEELIKAADCVKTETKIQAIIDHVRLLPTDTSVLFFTEYKVTQALLVSELWRAFGDGVATFINGDNVLNEVRGTSGKSQSLRESRESAKDRFNEGTVRFLVSTEAAGEGVDLQHRCSRLIHVDLPWNPMRLQQRVGRLNRLGQQDVVKVTLFQNPDTVESRIWSLLLDKIERISRSINTSTEDPEDLHQMILGTSSPQFYQELFFDGSIQKQERLDNWFDERTGKLGGSDAVEVVRELLGNAQCFDFGSVSNQVPKLDLPDLANFFKLSLRCNRRQVIEDDKGHISFKTPESWSKRRGVKPRYDHIKFGRSKNKDSQKTILGIGSAVVDMAIDDACSFTETFGILDSSKKPEELFVFRCFDKITGNVAQPKSIICGVLKSTDKLRVLRDQDVFECLNSISAIVKLQNDHSPFSELDGIEQADTNAIRKEVIAGLPSLEVPFKAPDVELIGVIRGSLEPYLSFNSDDIH